MCFEKLLNHVESYSIALTAKSIITPYGNWTIWNKNAWAADLKSIYVHSLRLISSIKISLSQSRRKPVKHLFESNRPQHTEVNAFSCDRFERFLCAEKKIKLNLKTKSVGINSDFASVYAGNYKVHLKLDRPFNNE